MRRNNTKYITEEFPTYRLGRLVVILDGVFQKILLNNRDCFNKNNCWPGTVTRKIDLGGGKIKIEVCLHNITHADKPAHLYADHLNNFYENKLKKINNQKFSLAVIRDKDTDKKITASAGVDKALFIIKNKINAGLRLLTDKDIDNIARLKFKVLMTNCLSVDPLNFPVNSKKSNHYRLMERGLVIVERVPLSIIKASIIKIIREYKSSSQDDAEAVNILSVK